LSLSASTAYSLAKKGGDVNTPDRHNDDKMEYKDPNIIGFIFIVSKIFLY